MDNFQSTVIFSSLFTGQIQQSDYINIGNFVAFLQDYNKTPEINILTKPLTFGIKTKLNFISLNIDY